MLKATQAAIESIKEELDDMNEDIDTSYIRLFMSPGWGGPRLKLALEESSSERDTITKIENIKFLIDDYQSYYFQNVKLDYVKNIFGFGEFTLLTV